MSRNPNFSPDELDLKLLRAIEGGAQTLREILPYTTYSSVGHIRIACNKLQESGFLTSQMTFSSGPRNPYSQWSRAPKARHFQITESGIRRANVIGRIVNPTIASEQIQA